METLESIDAALSAGQKPRILAADQALPHLQAVQVDAGGAVRIGHGQSIAVPAEVRAGRVRIYDPRGHFLGLGESDGSGCVRPRRLFVQA
jgi:hypothetical protein